MAVDPASTAADEQAIRAAFAREGLRGHEWSSAPGERFAAHEHAYHKVLSCLRGGITFRLSATGEEITLAPGSRLEIAPHTRHSAVAGVAGVTCIEAVREED